MSETNDLKEFRTGFLKTNSILLGQHVAVPINDLAREYMIQRATLVEKALAELKEKFSLTDEDMRTRVMQVRTLYSDEIQLDGKKVIDVRKVVVEEDGTVIKTEVIKLF